MTRYVAFLRGMNLGGRRITNAELGRRFEALGVANVETFLASGNVIFDAKSSSAAKLQIRIEEGLKVSLRYEVPTFVRSAAEVVAIAEYVPFAPDRIDASDGKLQVMMLLAKPSRATQRAVLKLETAADGLAFHGSELYWLPSGRTTDSELDLRAIEAQLGVTTMRTRRTVERLAHRYLAD